MGRVAVPIGPRWPMVPMSGIAAPGDGQETRRMARYLFSHGDGPVLVTPDRPEPWRPPAGAVEGV